MEHPVKYGIWQYGAKFSHLNIRSNNEQSVLQTNGTYEYDSTRSSIYNYKEYIEAAYGSFNKTFRKLEINIGLRLEYTQLKGVLTVSNTINKQSYLKVFPSLFIQYNKDEKHQFNFSANSRINRPEFGQLNPFRYYVTQYSYAEGNPSLQSPYSYNFSLAYTYKQRYSFTIYYNLLLKSTAQINYTNDFAKTNFWRWEGNRTIHDFGVYNQYIASVNDRWNINASLDAYIDYIKSPYLYNTTKRITWNIQFGFDNDFIFDKKERFTGNLNFYFKPPKRGEGEQTMRVYYKLDAGFRALLLKEKQLVISITANNILKTKENSGYFISPNGQYTSFENYYNDRAFVLAMTYKFGNEKLKTMAINKTDENINRVIK